jgi:prepilin-type N-terminal cleavage/methylation domain-containing protein
VTAREKGFTLVELMVAVALTGMIITALTGALIVGWRTTDDTTTRLADTRDRHLVPSLFTRDVQSAQLVETTGTACTGGDTLIARITMAQPQDAAVPPATRTVTYVLTSTKELVRRYCADGTTVLNSVAVAHDVVGTPTVACRVVAGGSTQTCADTSMVVDLTVSNSSGSFTATGRRRS